MQAIFSDTKLLFTALGIVAALGWLIYILFSAMGQGPLPEPEATTDQSQVGGDYLQSIQARRDRLQQLYDTELVGIPPTSVYATVLRKSLSIVDYGILATLAEKSGASRDVVVAINTARSDTYGELESMKA